MTKERESLTSPRKRSPLGPHFEAVRKSLDVHPNGHPCHLSLSVIQMRHRLETAENRELRAALKKWAKDGGLGWSDDQWERERDALRKLLERLT